MQTIAAPRSKVPNKAQPDNQEDNFSPGDALESLNAEIVQLEAIAQAASEAAILQFPYPPPGETRRAFARIYALVNKVADEAGVAVTHGEQHIAALGRYLQSRQDPTG